MITNDFYVKALFAAVLAILTGLVLIFAHHALKKARMRELQTFMTTEMLGRIRDSVMDLLLCGMDIIPEKLMEARNRMDREEESWTR